MNSSVIDRAIATYDSDQVHDLDEESLSLSNSLFQSYHNLQ